MEKILKFKKQIIIVLIILNAIATLGVTFAFWASSITGDSDQAGSNIVVGQWGTPIFTTQDFYDFATKTDSLATDEYYLANDLDFTGFNWLYTATNNEAAFRGTLNGNNKTISNLIINDQGAPSRYVAIFPQIKGGRVFDLTLDDVHIRTDFVNPHARAGLIGGSANQGNVEISNIKVINSTVVGSSSGGVAGIIGNVRGPTTVVTLTSIKAVGLKMYSRTVNVGGVIGRVNNGATVHLNDIEYSGSIYSNSNNNGKVGGLIGWVRAGAFVNISRVTVDATFQNTFFPNNLNRYSSNRLGGFIGVNDALSTDVNISHGFFTGSLFTRTNARKDNVGSVVGGLGVAATLTNVYHSKVTYRDGSGNPTYFATTQNGQMATMVNAATLPDPAWWNTFYTNFNGHSHWAQDPITGRIFLNM